MQSKCAKTSNRMLLFQAYEEIFNYILKRFKYYCIFSKAQTSQLIQKWL